MNLDDYLFIIKKRDDPYCDYCPDVRETVEHFALHCQKFNNMRLILFNELSILNISQDTIGLKIFFFLSLIFEDGSDSL